MFLAKHLFSGQNHRINMVDFVKLVGTWKWGCQKFHFLQHPIFMSFLGQFLTYFLIDFWGHFGTPKTSRFMILVRRPPKMGPKNGSQNEVDFVLICLIFDHFWRSKTPLFKMSYFGVKICLRAKIMIFARRLIFHDF